MDSKAWMVAAVVLAAGAANATCYSVHKADGSLILETSSAPVNLTLPLGDAVPEKFGPGAFMTMSGVGFFCPDSRRAQAAQTVVATADAKVRAQGKVPAQAQEAVAEQVSDEELLALKPDETPAQAR